MRASTLYTRYPDVEDGDDVFELTLHELVYA